MKYYIYEHQKRDDGEVNVQPVVSRTDLAKGLSYYYERLSKMLATKLYTSASVMITDENLNVLAKETVETSYVPTEEVTE